MIKKDVILSVTGLCVLLLLSLLLYWPVSGFGWITGMDQEMLIDNKLLYHLTATNVLDMFLSSRAGMYMPLSLLSYGIDVATVAGNPIRMIHIMNLVLHLLNIVLFFSLIQLISKHWAIPVLASLIFALHPLNLDAVAWISSRGVLLSSFFFISGLLAYEYFIRSKRPLFRNLGILACLAALFSHPVAALFPLVLIVLDHIQDRRPSSALNFKIVSTALAIIFIAITVLAATDYSRTGIDHALSIWVIPAMFILPLGISGTQTGFAIDLLQPAYLLVMVMSASLAYLFSLLWAGRSRVIVSGIFISAWLIGVVYISFTRIGDWENSEKYWNRIIELYPESHEAYFHRGDHWAMGGDFNRAKFDYTQSIKLNPEAYEAINNLGLIYLGENDLPFAIKEFKKAINIKEDFYKPHLNLGLAYMRRGDNELAKECMTRAIALNPGEAIAYYNRGLLYERDNMLSEAINDFSKAIRLDPYRYIFFKDRGKALIWMQNYAEAELDFSRALELDNSDPEMWFRRSLARVSQDKFKEGLEDALVARKLGLEVSEDYIKGLTRQILESDSVFVK